MKKILAAILLALLLFTPQVFAAAAKAITPTIEGPEVWYNGQEVYRIKIVLVSTGAAADEFSLKDELTTDFDADYAQYWMDKLSGGILYELVTDPGVQPDATYTLSFDCELGGNLLDMAALSATVTEHTDFSTDLGYNPVFWNDIDITMGDLGTENDSTTIYIYIVK